MPYWETVHSGVPHHETLRMEVPGGWIYLHKDFGFMEEVPVQIAMVFVPRPTDPKERV